MNRKLPLYTSGVLASALLASTLGCSKTPAADTANSDPQITSAIQRDRKSVV